MSDNDGCTNPIPGDSGKSAANPADVERNKASVASRTKDLFIDTHSPAGNIAGSLFHLRTTRRGRIGVPSIPILPTEASSAKLFSAKNESEGENPGTIVTQALEGRFRRSA